jgi:hypothetical protein
MTYYDPISGITFVVADNLSGTTYPIVLYPSTSGNSTAGLDVQYQEKREKAFMRTQWRLSEAKMRGVGNVASDWA